MTPERNVLMEQAYPRLKEYCRTKYRFEFQVTLGIGAYIYQQKALTSATDSLLGAVQCNICKLVARIEYIY